MAAFLALLPNIISIISQLLPELIALAKSMKTTPQEAAQKAIADVKAAMAKAAEKRGNTKPIEEIING